MWTQFADTGHPGHPWTPAHTADDDQYFVIDTGAMKMSSIGEVVNRFKHWSQLMIRLLIINHDVDSALLLHDQFDNS